MCEQNLINPTLGKWGGVGWGENLETRRVDMNYVTHHIPDNAMGAR